HMRVSRSASRAGSKARIDRGPRGGVSASAAAKTSRHSAARAPVRRARRRPRMSGMGEALYARRSAEVATAGRSRDHGRHMSSGKRQVPQQGRDLISLAQKLARDAERHAILSASLVSQADRLMVAGLQLLEKKSAAPKNTPRL